MCRSDYLTSRARLAVRGALEVSRATVYRATCAARLPFIPTDARLAVSSAQLWAFRMREHPAAALTSAGSAQRPCTQT
jgi:hypothetical protein